MPVDIVSIDFLDSDFSTVTTGVDYLNGSIGDKLTAEIVLDIHWETPIDTPMSISLSGIDSINRHDGGSFISDGFKNGDDILVSVGANVLVPVTVLGTFADKLNVTAGLSAELVPVDGIVYGVTPVQNLDFYYGIIENSSPNPTISLIDGSVQKFKSGTILHSNTTPSILNVDTTVNSWFYDLTDQNSTIEGLGALVDINHQQFKIVHEFYIQPVFVADDLTAPNTLSAPDYLANVQSLKYVPKIDCRYTTSGTNVDKSTSNGNLNQFIKSGDVAWFDETGNAGAADYTQNSIVYKKTLDNSIVTSVQPNAETDISINLASASGAFSNTGTDFIVQIYRTPTDATVYQNTITDIKENYLVSRQSLKINAAPTVAGEGFIKAGATATYISNTEAVIDFTFLPTFFLSQDQVSNDLQAFNQDPSNVADGYLIFVTCQDKTITDKGNSDKVAVLCDVNTAEGIDADDFYNTTGVCTTTTLFNDHPTNNELLAFTNYKGWLEDSVVTKTNIQVLKTNNDTSIDGNTIQNVWNLNNVVLKIEAEHKTDSSRFFTLEESKIFVAGVDETITRDFILPVGSPQNEIIWSQAASTATHNVFNLVYPFKIRWEDWSVLFGVDNDFTGNNDWVQYINADWEIKVNIYKEIDLAQDIGIPNCTFSFVNTVDFLRIDTGFASPPSTFEDSEGNIQTTAYFSNTYGNNNTRTMTMTAEDCALLTKLVFEVQGAPYSGSIQGALNLSSLTGIEELFIRFHEDLNSITIPTLTEGKTIEISACSSLTTIDLSGFQKLQGDVRLHDNLNLASVVLPASSEVITRMVVGGGGIYSGIPNELTGLDITPLTGANDGIAIGVPNNKFSVANINQLLIDLDAKGWINGTLFCENQTPAAPPSGAGATAKTNLQGKGWTVTTD